ncbi:universal stress protein [Embleya sp. NBC_00896]|uniref:universal stress protein n=1 Tax=Embleya sp. NBC_00896 TaxID=2975961 RepID=UPI002F911C62|nr:universal stress protein [Embleya sp. NBC_00896]
MTPHTARLSVVVGVEHTESGHLAVAWAADEAAGRGLPLRLVHALEWPVGAPEPHHPHTKEPPPRDRPSEHVHATSWPVQVYRDPDLTPPRHGWGDKFRDAGRRTLDRAHALALGRHPGLEVVDVLVDGDPVAVLRAEAVEAAMVVVGSRHLSAATELMTTGGIAVPLAAHAGCPVAVVRRPDHEEELTRTVVVGVDGAARSEPAIALAFDEASRRDAVVEAVLVTHATRHADEQGRVRLAESLAGWKEKYPDVVIRPQVAHGHPVRVLADRSAAALCLVVGSRGLGGFRGMLLGSVGHGLIHRASCPVIVVPSHDVEEA